MFQGVLGLVRSGLVRSGVVRSGVIVLSGALGSVLGCGARADDVMATVSSDQDDSSESLPQQPIGMPTALPSGPNGRPGCWMNQELVCEALGSSAAERCECRTIVPGTAADCALPEQFVCSDAGAECYCDDDAGCPPGMRASCDSYAPHLGCGCFTIYTR